MTFKRRNDWLRGNVCLRLITPTSGREEERPWKRGCDYSMRNTHHSVCLVTWPFSEIEVNRVALPQLSYVNQVVLSTLHLPTKAASFVSKLCMPTSASLPIKGQVNRHTTEKWIIRELSQPEQPILLLCA